MTCPITGEALTRLEFDKLDLSMTVVWEHADPEIHVSYELLNHEQARTLFEQRYEIGERCPDNPAAVHARLREPS